MQLQFRVKETKELELDTEELISIADLSRDAKFRFTTSGEPNFIHWSFYGDEMVLIILDYPFSKVTVTKVQMNNLDDEKRRKLDKELFRIAKQVVKSDEYYNGCELHELILDKLKEVKL